MADKFYLAFDIEKALPTLPQGYLVGVKGIAASPEIKTQFFFEHKQDEERALLIMNQEETISINDLYQIDYEDAISLWDGGGEIMFRLEGRDSLRHLLDDTIVMSVIEYSDNPVLHNFIGEWLRFETIFKYLDAEKKNSWGLNDLAFFIQEEWDSYLAGVRGNGQQLWSTDELEEAEELVDTNFWIRVISETTQREVAHWAETEKEWLVVEEIFNVPLGSRIIFRLMDIEQDGSEGQAEEAEEARAYNQRLKYRIIMAGLENKFDVRYLYVRQQMEAPYLYEGKKNRP